MPAPLPSRALSWGSCLPLDGYPPQLSVWKSQEAGGTHNVPRNQADAERGEMAQEVVRRYLRKEEMGRDRYFSDQSSVG